MPTTIIGQRASSMTLSSHCRSFDRALEDSGTRRCRTNSRSSTIEGKRPASPVRLWPVTTTEQAMRTRGSSAMKIKLASVFVDDQEKALRFYTEILGFVKKQDVTAGEYRWLTVASPEEPDGTQLLLEPNANPVAKTYQRAIFEQGISAAVFFVDDARQEYDRLKQLGVEFRTEPTDIGPAIFAVLDDTCGNFIQFNQMRA
jgi:catechol 2,3-dioxygenase-like lactoylglutathione lyase family enzyme